MLRAIARVRGIPGECIVPGAGSSDLIFLAFRKWLTPASRVLILDPSYGEYAHVLEQIVRCRVDRLTLLRRDGYVLDPSRLEAHVAAGYDLIVLVNPNNPTGRHLRRRELEEVLAQVPARTRVWLDETYVEYAGGDESFERVAAASGNVIVCKSMSKVYALSGLRAAYLCAPAPLAQELRSITPPWAVSLPAQVAAVAALGDPDYYQRCYQETHELRKGLIAGIRRAAAVEIIPSVTNFFLCHLREDGPTAATVYEKCRARGLFLRDAARGNPSLGAHTLRFAVKDAAANRRMIELFSTVLSGVG
jgi:histidinol-phosphate/aromatic aminotransferase/cobyric acid decarboxylase-like protein